jgi:hypothetical protein
LVSVSAQYACFIVLGPSVFVGLALAEGFSRDRRFVRLRALILLGSGLVVWVGKRQVRFLSLTYT